MKVALLPRDYMVHGILQARILEWVAIPFFRGSSQPRDQIQVSHIAGGFFTVWATREVSFKINFINEGIGEESQIQREKKTNNKEEGEL